MTNSLIDAINHYIEEPTELLVLENIRIGRMKLGRMVIRGRGAGYNALDVIGSAFEKTARVRSGKHGTRHLEPLPLCAPARLLSIEINDYLQHQKRRGLRPGTIDDTSRTLRLLLIACGDIPVSHIDHQLICKAWDFIQWAPPDVHTSPASQGKTCDELIEIGRRLRTKPPSESTMDKHQRLLVTFFKKLESTGAIRLSPMAGFGRRRKDLTRSSEKVERFFDTEDLRRIFDPTTYLSWAQKYPHRWWCPILALYTGARINELAQLKLIDIVEDAGHWSISIQPTEDQDLGRSRQRSRQCVKGASAIRTIPLHPKLLEAGFMDFVDDMRRCGHPRLFPHLSAGVSIKTGETNARYSQGVLNQFSTYLKDLGFSKGIGFHAFRHTFVTALSQRGVRDADIALLTGHSKGGEYKVVQVYKKKKPLDEAERRWAALQAFEPDVSVPRYRAGQFAKCLSDPKRFYP